MRTGASDTIKPRGHTRRTTVYPLNLRLSMEQDERIRARAERRDITVSAATRELIDMGSLLDAAEDSGLVVTDLALKLMGTDHGALVRFARDVPAEAAASIALTAKWELEALARGALLICTEEQAARMTDTLAHRDGGG